jgi:dUTP pyrophosphatase
MRARGFELVSKYTDRNLLPQRSTKYAAAYDLKAAKDYFINPYVGPKLIATGVKAYMDTDEYLEIVNRSSGPIKRGIVCANGVGIIDADYYNNSNNEGEIFAQVMNITDMPIEIKKGDRICQGIFHKYLVADNDQPGGQRKGGFGSTDDDNG